MMFHVIVIECIQKGEGIVCLLLYSQEKNVTLQPFIKFYIYNVEISGPPLLFWGAYKKDIK